MDIDDDFDMIIDDNDDYDYDYDDGIYDNEPFIVSDFEEKEVDKLTKIMNSYLESLNDFIKELGENIDLKEYFKERNECINELKNNFNTLCDNNQYVIENSFLLSELKKIICKTIEGKEIELLNQKNNIGVERYEMQLKKYEMKLQLYEIQKTCHPTNTKIINKLKKDVEDYEKKIFK
jgi:2-hydroxy-3-keto-5-methylthiopentenyl-1-phosphate phosphatase